MKSNYALTLAALGLAACLPPAHAQLVIPSDGSDGAFNPPVSPTNVVIDLSQAVPGVWNADNSANAGKGIYDSNKWAVVFKYSSVNIPTGVTVSFKNHASRAPVVWLVNEAVSIGGTIRLDGPPPVTGPEALVPAEPGPGGFRGGPSGPPGAGAGLGPGGANAGGYPGGSHSAYASVYGNPQILPLIGGSGSGGYTDEGNRGAAGGGALLIATAGNLVIEGVISSQGGASHRVNSSGGAVRVIANQVLGAGEINCLLDGRVRIEASALAASLRTFPETIAVPPANPPLIWPPDGAPKVRIVNVDTFATPAEPTAPLVSSADVAIQNDNPAVVLLETREFPIEGVVDLRVSQKWGAASWVRCSYVSGNQAQATWRAQITFVKGYTTLQARATAP
jgi:hypothetical protein